MALNLKTCVKVGTIIGGCIGVPLILKQKAGDSSGTDSQLAQASSITTPQLSSKTTTSHLPAVAKARSTNGNCEITALPKDLEDFLLDQGRDKKNYVTVLCQDTNTETSANTLSYAWTGLFPRQVLTDLDTETIGNKFILKTEHTWIEGKENFKTTFKSDKIKFPISNLWGEILKTRTGVSVMPVPIAGTANLSEPIYLRSY